ncbi:hypothetical protein HPB50_013335 [Hyalomma asiaticum]|uniref:Uncharacterized protein n=1 Tax=Hyalomma asiaticum TaxID=266040 RepID=A0ACB7SHI9_HYAAI|nr:hypothetical protein HPB50_013335 [Hyalomma asiaticum]
MDSFQRHGGLLIDEIKLSEHLSLESNGTLEGLVDLGKFTSESNLAEAHEVLSECGHGTEHGAIVVQTSDSRLVYYKAGYVARKSIASKKCTECSQQLLQDENNAPPAVASLTTSKDEEACFTHQPSSVHS